MWIKASELREQVARLLAQPVEQLGHTQWIAHIMNRLQLPDTSKRKRQTCGIVYCMPRRQVLDMMHRNH